MGISILKLSKLKFGIWNIEFNTMIPSNFEQRYDIAKFKLVPSESLTMSIVEIHPYSSAYLLLTSGLFMS